MAAGSLGPHGAGDVTSFPRCASVCMCITMQRPSQWLRGMLKMVAQIPVRVVCSQVLLPSIGMAEDGGAL